MNGPFPSIARAFSFLPDDTIVDGELVVLDEDGRPSFNSLQHSRFTADALYFYAFDLLAYQGKDLRKLTLLERRSLLEDYALKRMRDPVRLSAVFHAQASKLVAAGKRAGLEAIISGTRASSRCAMTKDPMRW